MALFIDGDAWRVESLRARLRSDVADESGTDRNVFHAGEADIPVRMIQSAREHRDHQITDMARLVPWRIQNPARWSAREVARRARRRNPALTAINSSTSVAENRSSFPFSAFTPTSFTPNSCNACLGPTN